MTNGLYQADQLPLVGRQVDVTGREGTAEVGEGPDALVEDGAEPCARRVAVDHEGLSKVWHLKNRSCGQSALERLECRRRIVVPHKRVPPQETREWGGDDAEVLNEFPVVAREAEETTQATGRARQGPRSHDGDLVSVHGDATLGDHVAQVGH